VLVVIDIGSGPGAAPARAIVTVRPRGRSAG
jgi:hypothetical protein